MQGQAWSRPGRQARESRRRRAQPPPDRADNAPFTLIYMGAPRWPPNPPALVTPRGTRGAPRFCVHCGPPLHGPPAPGARHAPGDPGAPRFCVHCGPPRNPRPNETSRVARCRGRLAVPCGHADSTTTAHRLGRDRAGVCGARARRGGRLRHGDHGLQESDLRLLCGVGGSPAHERVHGAGRGHGRSGADQDASRRAA